MNCVAFIHDDDIDSFIDFIKDIDPGYQLVYKLMSIPYIKIECTMSDQDILAAKLTFNDNNHFHRR